jgi:hypothetical protein
VDTAHLSGCDRRSRHPLSGMEKQNQMVKGGHKG